MSSSRYLPFALSFALLGCPGPTGGDAGDARPPGDAADDGAADVQEDTAQPDVPVVPRCGPDAVPYRTDRGMCAVANPLPDGGMPAPGACTARVNGAAATLMANEMDGDALVLPSGRRVQRAAERRGLSGFPMSMLRLPGTDLMVVSDGGIHTNRLRVINTASATLDVVTGGEVEFARDGSGRDPALFYGLAYDAATRVLYASGGGSNRIYAYDVAPSGALTANPGRTIDLMIRESAMEGTDAAGNLRSGYPSGLALSDDGTQLYVGMQRGHAIAVFNTMTAQMIRVIPLESTPESAPYPYAVIRRPGDARHVYASLWGTRQVAEIDTEMFTVTRVFNVGKNPEELLFSPDGRLLYVAASDSDAVSILDVSMPTPMVRNVYLGGSENAPRGISPSALAWGPSGRLYVVLANENAIDVLEQGTLARVGRIPTEWYPTDVDVAPNGDVIVTTGKGIGSGPNLMPSAQENTELMSGSIARYTAPSDTTLAAGDVTVTRNNSVMSTFNDVQCPAGAPYDFPVPPLGSTQGSTRIRHVVLVVRENKTYDAILGDYEGSPGNPANGDPTLTLIPRDRQDAVYPNIRALVRRFGNLDNYYSNAEQSLQGHVLTSQARSTDHLERTWLTNWGRASRSIPNQGINPIGLPEEGTIFQAMERANIDTENWGEIVGNAAASQRVGSRYPGVFYNMTIPDIDKARALGNSVLGVSNQGVPRACDFARFTYIILPNDHTSGGTGGQPTPTSMIQDNDEATGFLIDAISHSRFWPETLVIVIEDDPQDGGDHVDGHRSIALIASPWVRRGATSHVHYDESSLHHTIELILGVPAHNSVVARAAPLYDIFSNTPDYTPFTYIPRRECEERNPRQGQYVEESSRMDFSEPDNAPGLARLLWRMMHNNQEPPWTARPAEPDDDDD